MRLPDPQCRRGHLSEISFHHSYQGLPKIFCQRILAVVKNQAAFSVCNKGLSQKPPIIQRL